MSTGRTLVVIGGGAAGFFCAVTAARLNPALQVIIIEKTGKLLSKVRVSGGGRCNVTHACFDISEMSRRYPRGSNFVKKTFHQFFTTDTIEWFEARGVALKTEPDGRMFPVSNSSESIVSCLMKEAQLYAVDIRTMSEVKGIRVEEGKFQMEIKDLKHPASANSILYPDFICIATGGYPKADMFDWLRDAGHTIADPVPSLFTFNLPAPDAALNYNGKHPITTLMGVSVEKVRIKIESSRLVEEGPMLITHWGISGPAVLKLSAWGARELKVRDYTFGIHINWLPDVSEQTVKQQFQNLRLHASTKKIINSNFTSLPRRLWEFLLVQSGITPEMRFAELPAKLENTFIRSLTDYVLQVKGKTTFKEEFVTAGGILLNEVDPSTLMSKKADRLFFAGEVLDVDGVTGGFNFQNAWTTGYIAGKTIAAMAK